MAWGYFGNASKFNKPEAWLGLPNLSVSDQKVLGSFAHGNVYLLNGGGVVRDDNMKYRIARIAVSLFGSPLSLEKFLKVGVRWNSESNVWDSVRSVTDAVGDLAKADVNLLLSPTSSVTGKEAFASKDFGKDRQGLSDATKFISDVLPSGGIKTVLTGKAAFEADSFHDKKLGEFAKKASQASGVGSLIAVAIATGGASLETFGGAGGAASLVGGALSLPGSSQNVDRAPAVQPSGCGMFFIPPLVGMLYLFYQLI